MNNKGFSLVELLAVIALLAIILLLFTPNITKMIDKFKDEDKMEILKSSAIAAAKEFVADGMADTSEINCNINPISNTFEIKVVDDLVNNKYLNDDEDGNYDGKKITVTYDCSSKKFTKYDFK